MQKITLNSLKLDNGESLLQKNLMDIYYGLAQFNISDSYNG